MTDLTAVSLFAGIGALDEAMRRAGVRVVAAVEIDPACRSVLRRHFPEVVLFDDVTEVTGDQLRTAGFVPSRGILGAGWPCQGNSVAGHRGGMGDPRSGLWLHVARLLAELRPAWFVGENVPGLYSVNNGADIAVVRSDLAQRGYWWAERVLDAQHFGVPQRRRRIFFAGCLGNRSAPVQVLFEPESRAGDTTAGAAAGTRVAGTLAASLGGGGLGGAGQSASAITSRLVEAPVAVAAFNVHAAESCAKQRHAYETTTARCLDSSGGFASSQGGAVIAATLQGGGRRGHRVDAEGAAGGHLVASTPLPSRAVSHALTAREGKGVDSDGTNGNLWVTHALTSEGSDASEDGTGRSTPIVPIGVPPHKAASAVRRLTPLECERLQGLPAEWTRYLEDGTEQSDSARYRQCGNAMALPVIEWVARRLVAADQAQREDTAA
jgi:DNA (cytosine-5)-methyltransferase 1